MIEKIKQWDIDLFIYLNNSGIESLDGFWLLVTKITFWIPLFILIFYLIFRSFKTPKSYRVTSFFLGLVFTSIALMELTKRAVGRLRPNNLQEISESIRVLKDSTDFSFYSGHASSSFAIATFAFLIFRKKFKWFWLVFIFPILFTLSRIFVGVHFPIDLFMGSLVGVFLAFIFYLICKNHLSKMNKNSNTT